MNRAVAVLVGVISLAAGVSAAQAQAMNVETQRSADTRTVTVRSGAFSLTQTLTRTGFRVRVAEPSDVVEFSGDADGGVSIRRGSRVVRYAMPRVTAADFAKSRALVAGSRALATLARVHDGLDDTDKRLRITIETAVASVALFQGDQQPLMRLAARARAASNGGIMTVGQRTRLEPGGGPDSCWMAYQRDVIRYTYEYETCLRDASESLNPLRGFTCVTEYNLRTTLAFYWLLDCSGFPIPG